MAAYSVASVSSRLITPGGQAVGEITREHYLLGAVV